MYVSSSLQDGCRTSRHHTNTPGREKEEESPPSASRPPPHQDCFPVTPSTDLFPSHMPTKDAEEKVFNFPDCRVDDGKNEEAGNGCQVSQRQLFHTVFCVENWKHVLQSALIECSDNQMWEVCFAGLGKSICDIGPLKGVRRCTYTLSRFWSLCGVGGGVVRHCILRVFLLRKDEKVDVKHIRLHHKLFHGHFVVSGREESFQAVFGYMKPESAIQWLQKKKKSHRKAGLVIRLKAASCRTKRKVWRSGDLRDPSPSVAVQLRSLGHIIYSDQLQPLNV